MHFVNLVVLDGDEPATWDPWGIPLGTLDKHLATFRPTAPEGFESWYTIRVRLLLRRPNEILTLEDALLASIAGAIVETSHPDERNMSQSDYRRKEQLLLSRLQHLCEAIRYIQTKSDMPRCIMEEVGFHVRMLFHPPWDQVTANWQAKLEDVLAARLPKGVNWRIVPMPLETRVSVGNNAPFFFMINQCVDDMVRVQRTVK